MPDQERTRNLGRVLAGHALPLRTRAAAAIVLLYAQPASRIVRLTVDDVTCEDGEVFLRLGDPPSPVPGPVAGILLSWIGSRTNMRTATNRDSAWLFPGRRAGQPMRADYLARLLNEIGIPTTAGRASAIRQHVLETPAPVVADALSYSQGTPPGWPPRPAAPSAATPPATTSGGQQAKETSDRPVAPCSAPRRR
jgi:integrase